MMTAVVLGLLALSVLALLAALAFLYRWIVRSRVFPQLPKLWKADKQRFLISSGAFVVLAIAFAAVGIMGVGAPSLPDPTTPPEMRPTGPSFESAGTQPQTPGEQASTKGGAQPPGETDQDLDSSRPELGGTGLPQPQTEAPQIAAQTGPSATDDAGFPASPDQTGGGDAQADLYRPGDEAPPVAPEPGQDEEPGSSIVPDLASQAQTSPQIPARSKAAPPKSVAQPKPQPKAAPEPAPKPKPAPAAKPKPKPEPKSKVAAKPKPKAQEAETAGGPKFTVCVSSFKNKSLAASLNSRLKKLGFSTRIISAKIKGKGVWHRVCVGTFESWRKAVEMSLRIQKRGISKSPFVIAL
jgi:cell division protein FtsN